MGDEDHRRRCPSVDRLSSLPDELLQVILLGLGSTCAAARTSVLSRRWRHLWVGLPELVLVRGGPDAPPGSFHDTVDAALDAHAAPTLDRLLICDSDASDAIPSARAAPWLRLAAERVAGALLLLVPPRLSSLAPVALQVQELELPACVRAKTVTLKLQNTWLLRPAPAGGVFTALTALTILYGRMEGGDLTALVSTRCPCLKDLRLRVTLVDASDVSIRSDTLRSLWFYINSPLIEVVAPSLEKLWVYYAFKARFSVPKLSELVWTGDYANESHQFVNVSRSLQQLDITRDHRFAPTSLLEKFSQVDELNMIICIPRGTEGYESFLSETTKLPKCRTLNISLEPKGHGLAPCILHFLRNCSSAKKVSVRLLNSDDDSQYSCLVSCSCRLAESRRIDDAVLSSIEEFKISSCTSSHEELEFVELFSKCDATNLKRLVIDYYKKKFQASVESKEICKKICSMYGLNVEVEFYVVGQGRRVCFDWRRVKNVSRKMVTTT